MTDDNRAEWSRHYDYMTWLSITIFTTVISILLGFANSKDGKSIGIAFFGLLLTNVTVWFTAGFRWFRRQLALQVADHDLAKLLTGLSTNRPMPMWKLFLATFFVLDALWVKKLLDVLGSLCSGTVEWSLASLVLLGLIAFFWHAYRVGESLSYDEWLRIHPQTTLPEAGKSAE